MPHAEPVPILPPSTIVVTGANGFIAYHVIHSLLQTGYNVVGTVRTEAKAAAVQRTFRTLIPSASHLLTTKVVPSITDPNAYTRLFKTTSPTAVIHLASPFTYTVQNFETDLLEPAVNGTTAVLSAAAETSSIKRIIHMNSFACVYDASLGPRPGYTYTAEDWSPLSYNDGASAPNAAVAYRASKTVAEKTAWSFINAQHPKPEFDVVSLCPAMVFGPFLDTNTSLPGSIEQLNASNKLVWDVVSAGSASAVPPTKGPVWIDVRDGAQATVKALVLPKLGGRRLLLAKGVYCSQEIADIASEVATKHSDRIPIGLPGMREAKFHFNVDASEEEEFLTDGRGWRDLKQTLTDLVPQLFRIESATQ